MTLSNWHIFTKIIHLPNYESLSVFIFFFPVGLQSSAPAEGAISRESKPDPPQPVLPLSEPVNNQQWEKICWRTNKEVDKRSSPPFTKEDETP